MPGTVLPGPGEEVGLDLAWVAILREEPHADGRQFVDPEMDMSIQVPARGPALEQDTLERFAPQRQSLMIPTVVDQNEVRRVGLSDSERVRGPTLRKIPLADLPQDTTGVISPQAHHEWFIRQLAASGSVPHLHDRG